MTATTRTWSDELTGVGALHHLAPAAGEVLGQLVRTIAAPAEQVALVRRVCAAAQELTALPAPRGAGSPTDAAAAGTLPEEQALLRFTEQFSVDVSALTEDLRGELWTLLGETPRQARGRLLAMMWVADLVPRVLSTLDRLFGPSDWDFGGAEQTVDDATPLAHEFVRVVHTLDAVDPILSDLVRLRGAHAHNCRLCKSLRSRSALAAGATVEDFDGSGDLAKSALTPAYKGALALVDAMIWHPARIEEDVLDAVRTHFTPAQAVEIVLDVMRNAWNKTTVAAQLDEAHVTDGVEVYQYHDDGTVEFALDAPQR
jgi:alkylhydroperoxidase family enzyme